MKPENVIVPHGNGVSEEAVLIDFSIAIIKDANETLYGLSRAAGTFDYMAPEQALGHAQPASDIFSLAKLAVEMLTGTRVAHLLPNEMDLPGRVPEFLKGFGLSEGSVEMLARALEFDPKNRPKRGGGVYWASGAGFGLDGRKADGGSLVRYPARGCPRI